MINTTDIQNRINHLQALVKIHTFEKNPRGRGNLARQHLYWRIKNGTMSMTEFNRRFDKILTYETLGNGIFDADLKEKEDLQKLQTALNLINEVNSNLV